MHEILIFCAIFRNICKFSEIFCKNRNIVQFSETAQLPTFSLLLLLLHQDCNHPPSALKEWPYYDQDSLKDGSACHWYFLISIHISHLIRHGPLAFARIYVTNLVLSLYNIQHNYTIEEIRHFSFLARRSQLVKAMYSSRVFFPIQFWRIGV